MLLVAIFFLALLVLSLAVAAPQIAKSIQRDRDLETWHRGMQYRRAIQLYYRKFQAYPPNLDALVKTNDIRFLRKKYADPITGQADWKPIMFGQNKTPTAMGFFGQPLAGSASTLAGVGPSGGNGLAGTPNAGGASSPFGGSSFGGSPSGGSIFGSSDSGNSSSTPTGISDSGSSSTDNSGGTNGSTSGGDNSGGTGSGGSTSSGTASTGSGLTGQTFGGAGIIGFSPASSKQSILVYKKKNHYNEWEFTYDPLSELKTIGATGGANPSGLGPGGTPSGQPGSSPWGPNGNLPAPPGEPPPGSPGSNPETWSPNGNLPASQ
ncbi:MAG: type II secretion system protein [Terracidiphilus sp.]